MAIDRSDQPEPDEPAPAQPRERPSAEDRQELYTRIWEQADRQEFGAAMERIRNEVQPKVRELVEEAKDAVPETTLVGLEFELKGTDRCWEKVGSLLRERADLSATEATAKVPDVIRYTCQFATENYVDGHNRVCGFFEERGLTLDYRWNAWGNPEYKGINTRWETPEGDRFEVQFHTAESFEVKQATHGSYEKLRAHDTPDEERARLKAYQREISESVPIPDGVDDVQDYRKGRSG